MTAMVGMGQLIRLVAAAPGQALLLLSSTLAACAGLPQAVLWAGWAPALQAEAQVWCGDHQEHLLVTASFRELVPAQPELYLAWLHWVLLLARGMGGRAMSGVRAMGSLLSNRFFLSLF